MYEKNKDSSIGSQYDGEMLENVLQASLGKDVPIYELEGSAQGMYYLTTFEYLNTYYEVSSDIGKEQFTKIVENIVIKSE